ncbi:MAG: preprotein translocase subunit SecD [Halanaeroarchaeum sp.]
MSALREYWRVSLLIALLLLSSVALFAPGLAEPTPEGQAAAPGDDPTNLQYGLALSGGARVRTTVDGVTATGVALDGTDPANLSVAVAEELGIQNADVRVRPGQTTATVEAYGNVTQTELRNALEALGYQPKTVRPGVTEATRDLILSTLRAKIDATGFAAATVTDVQTQDADRPNYIVVEAANRNVSEIRELVTSRGVVTLVASYPENGTQTRTTVLSQEALHERGTIGQPTTSGGQPAVPVTLSEEDAREFANDMVQFGFTQPGGYSTPDGPSACQFNETTNTAQNGSHCLLTVRDGTVVYAAGVQRSLATSFENGDFVKDPNFVITATSREEARQLYADLRAGSLPAPLTFEQHFSVEPSMGSKFKLYSLITGIFAIFAVSGAVFFRYRDPRIALPMIVTALSEVYLLLGFAASVDLALNLSHIAGLIAVVGTGVDDLVIIADEVMTEDVSSNRVFQSRFRKALWVIGAAALTTIIAMGPLAVLSLGDLSGFAIITILGVLIGVLLTRPAYGDVLRYLITADN